MLSVDFNEVSAVNAGSSPIERVYVGSDIAWTEEEQMRFIVELSGGQLCAFSLSEIDQTYGLDMFTMTWSQTFVEPFSNVFGRQISKAPPIVKIRDNQSTGEYGINNAIYSVSYLSDMVEAVFPKAVAVFSNAFKMCTSLQRVCLTNVSAVYGEAFAGCRSLTSIQLPKLNILGDLAFWECSSLVSIDLGQLEVVPNDAFRNVDSSGAAHSNLEVAFIPHALSVNYRAFGDAQRLHQVYSPSLEYIDLDAFIHCTTLSSINLENVKHIGQSGLESSGLARANLVNCEVIESRGLLGNEKLEQLYAPSLKIIGDAAFSFCSNLTSIAIPEVETIGRDAFNGCSFTNATFKRLQSISERGLSCSTLSSIAIYNMADDGIPDISGEAVVGNASIPQRCIVYVADPEVYHSMCQSSGLSSTQDRVILLDCKDRTLKYRILSPRLGEVKDIRVTSDKLLSDFSPTGADGQLVPPFDMWRDYSTGQTEQNSITGFYEMVDEAAQVSSVGERAFQDFTSISSISMRWCKQLGDGALMNCTSLVQLDMPNLEVIGQEALRKTKLSSIDFPQLTSAGDGAFNAMSALADVKLNRIAYAPQPLFVDTDSLTSLQMNSLSAIDSILGIGFPDVVEMSLPAVSAFLTSISMSKPRSLSSLNLASISYSDFVGGLSAYVAVGFAQDGCSLTCSDGVFVVH